MTEVKQEIKIGDELPDGTILAGYYEGKPVYTTPFDATTKRWLFRDRLTYTFKQAVEYAQHLNAQKFLGHDDWRLPKKGELNILYENRNKGKLTGTFNATGSYHGGWYWSSTQTSNDGAWGQGFSGGDTGIQGTDRRHFDLSLRCVR